MTYDVLEKELNSGKLEPLYLIYGEEEYLIDKALKKIKKSFGELLDGMNFIQIDEESVSDIIENIESPAFGFDKKLIIVRNSGLFKKDGRKKAGSPIQEKIATYINENKSIIEDMVTIVFCEKEADKNNVFTAIEKNGIVVECSGLKPNQIISNLKKIAGMYKVNLPDDVANYFIEIAGTSMQELINEIRKLIEYAGEGGTITKIDVDNLTTKQIEGIIFDLTDNLGAKKTDKAIEVLDSLVYMREPLQKILVTLYNHFKKLYFCSIAINNNQDVTRALNLKPNQMFLVTKYKKQATLFKAQELRKLLEELANLDYNYKIGGIDLDIGLKSILCAYC